MPLHPCLYLGTSSWSSVDWEGVFYPSGTAPRDYLAHYATRYRTVEVDATFYRIPQTTTTARWRRVLPEGFLLAAKVPQSITHEKLLHECGEELSSFLAAMDPLGDRLGPLLLQFPYFSRGSGVSEEIFLDRLERFLPLLPPGYRFAVELRNKGWLGLRLRDQLAARGVALALIDHPWMPRVDRLLAEIDPITADFTYVRWLGDRHGIERVTRKWDQVIVDRRREMEMWVPAIRGLLERGVSVFGYFNNHYAGHAPASIDLFERTWETSALSPGPGA